MWTFKVTQLKKVTECSISNYCFCFSIKNTYKTSVAICSEKYVDQCI